VLSAITLAVALISPLTAPASAQTGGALVERTITLSDAALDNVPQPIPRTALVVAPQDPAPGSPVAVFLAGMHANCTYPSSDGGDITGILFPCPGQTIPNWRGYRYLQRELASRGWITMSVDPNAVNALTANYPDYGASARGQLITSYMADWIRWTNGATSPIPGVLPRADLSSVLLVGHSRGGEGVNAAARTAIGWQARGMFNLAPTMDGMNPAPGIPSVTLLGTCDDDVSDLQGQLFVDGAVGSVRDRAMRSSVLIAHATHNAFNTVWSSDRWNGGNDSRCPNRQLPASIQRKVATAYLLAAIDAFAGSPAELIEGPDLPSGTRTWWAGLGGPVQRLAGAAQISRVHGRGAVCRTVTATSKPCLRGFRGKAITPNWTYPQFTRAAPSPEAMHVRGPVRVRFDTPLRTASARLLLRWIAEPGRSGRLKVRAWDSRGRSARLGSVRLAQIPNRVLWAQPVVFRTRGLRDIARLRVEPLGRQQQGWLWDASAYRPGTYPDPAAAPQPQVRVDWASTAAASQNGTQRASVAIRVAQRDLVAGPIRLWVQQPHMLPPTNAESLGMPDLSGRGRVITLPAGQDFVTFELSAPTGPGYLGGTRTRGLIVRPVSEVVVEQYAGGLVVFSSSELPVVSPAGPRTITARPGDTLAWSLQLSQPPSVELVYGVIVQSAKIRVADVPAAWIRRHGGRVTAGNRDKPLRTAFGEQSGIEFRVEPGTSVYELRMPTTARLKPSRVRLLLANGESMDFSTTPVDSLDGYIGLTARIRN